MGVPGDERKENNYLGRDMDIWVQNVERTPTKINTRCRYIIIKILKIKDKERIANAARKK